MKRETEKGRILLWDVDTQRDFMNPEGKLYVPGAENTLPRIRQLQDEAIRRGYSMAGSVDAHEPEDPEFKLFPEHCVYGTPGQKKIMESSNSNAVYVPMRKLGENHIKELARYKGQVIFEKNSPECSVNENIKPYLELMQPEEIRVYGVVSEICVDRAVNYIAGKLGYNVAVIKDAIKELDPKKASECLEAWRSMGVRLV